MHKLTKLLGALSLATIFSGCDFLAFLAETSAPTVEMNYYWRNNLINVPVIEGTLKNNTSCEISNTTIQVQTFNEKHECICTTSFTVCEDIPAGNSIPFKEWITASFKACDLKALVVSYN
jgi:hypothetical protein